jgi:hypothetical protein
VPQIRKMCLDMIKYSSKFSSYTIFVMTWHTWLYGQPLCPLGLGLQRADNAVRECPHVSDVPRRWRRGGVSVFVRTRVPDLETSPMMRAESGGRGGHHHHPMTRARHSTCAREAPPRLRPCACTFIYARTIRAQLPHQLAALPHRRRRGAMPCRCCTAVLAIRAQIVRFSAHRIYWYRRPIDDPS